MDKRTVLALILMLALFLVFDQFVWKPQREQKAAETAAQTQSKEAPASKSTVPAPKDSLAAAPMLPDSLSSPDAKEQDIVLSNPRMKVTFSSRGARIKQINLPDFKMAGDKDVALINANSTIAGSSVILENGTRNLDNLIFNVRSNPDSAYVVFYLGEAAKPMVEKTFKLDQQYGIAHEIKIRNMGAVKGLELDFSSGIADTEKNLKSKKQDYSFLLYGDAKLQKLSMSAVKKGPQAAIGSYSWAAIRSKYFAIAIQENEPQLTKHFSASLSEANESPSFKLSSAQSQLKDSWQQSFLFYTGPTDYKVLAGYGKSLQRVSDRGANWLRWLSNIFAWFLNLLQGLLRNYGVTIIIFSIVIKVLLHPFTHKQMDASLKMQRIQPQVSAIQTQYKNDPKLMQSELSKLYKENGASPFSGCLPLLIQMPIFFSLYNVLRYSMDMRNASFVGWLSDLSEPDPYMILPVLMAVFMVLQSMMMRPPKQDPAQMDEKQKAALQSQKMMTYMMPVMMFFIFRGMPSGLVLYWTVFNILSVIQQYYLQKHFKQKES